MAGGRFQPSPIHDDAGVIGGYGMQRFKLPFAGKPGAAYA